MQILFITSGSIGDAILSTGLLGYLIDTYPSAVFTVAAGPAAAPLFEAMPRLARVITIRKEPRGRHWLKVWKEVRGRRWDMVVDLRGGVIGFLLRARRIKVFHHPSRKKSKAEQLAALFRLSPPPPPRLWSSEAAQAKAKALLPEGRRIIAIAPLTNSSAKDWPMERFTGLMRRLDAENTVFVILASAAQKEAVQPLVKALPEDKVLDLSGATDLLTAYAILERTKLFIGNDSGLLHMAAAARIPCVGIYGPSNDKVYAPLGSHVAIVTAREFKMGEEELRDNAFMQMISVEKVEAAVRALMG